MEEYLQLFDENRVEVDEKIERHNKANIKKGRHYMVVLIFMENEKGEFLLQKTSKNRGSIIATTGGHVTYQDTSLETVIKECKEELGLDINKDELVFVGTNKYEDAFEDVYYTNKKIDIDKLVLQKEEVDDINWYSVKEIKELINKKEFREGNIDAFDKVLEYRSMN